MDDAAQAMIGVHESNHLIFEPATPEVQMFNGALYLKTIIGLAHIDTRATTAHIKQSLGKLLARIAELDYNISEFNDYIKIQRSALMSRGEESTNLLVNLFKALGRARSFFPDLHGANQGRLRQER